VPHANGGTHGDEVRALALRPVDNGLVFDAVGEVHAEAVARQSAALQEPFHALLRFLADQLRRLYQKTWIEVAVRATSRSTWSRSISAPVRSASARTQGHARREAGEKPVG
jgi:hypothetical protein